MPDPNGKTMTTSISATAAARIRRELEAEAEAERLRAAGIRLRRHNVFSSGTLGWKLDEQLEELEFAIAWARERARSEDQLGAFEQLLAKFVALLPPAPQPRSARETPDSLGVLGRAPAEAVTGVHESAHGCVGDLVHLDVHEIVGFPDGSGETTHAVTTGKPRERALVALAGVVVGDVVGRPDPVGITSDLEVAREAAAELDPRDPERMFEVLKAEAEQLVRDNLRAIGRLADVLERFDGRLAGWQVRAALDWAFARPAPKPVPGPRDRDREILWQFAHDRRAWQSFLAGQLPDSADDEARRATFWDADVLARDQQPPPRRPATATTAAAPDAGSPSVTAQAPTAANADADDEPGHAEVEQP